MKKNYLLAFAAMGLLTLGACSDDNEVVGGPEEQAGEQVIVLDMQDTDALVTRSRPLYSTENKGAEEVTHVKLLVFKKDDTGNAKKLVKEINISNWKTSSSPYNYGNQYTYVLKGEDKLEAGTYEILAVGQNQEDDNHYTWSNGTNGTRTLESIWWSDFTNGPTWSSSANAGEGFSAFFTSETTPDKVQEIFAGQTYEPILVQSDGSKFASKVLLKRQVAGVLGYFGRIPSKVGETNARYLRLVACNANKQLDLSIGLEQQLDNTTSTTDAKKVINGFNPVSADATFGVSSTNGTQTQADAANNAVTIYQVDLRDWFLWDATNSKWDNSALVKNPDYNAATKADQLEYLDILGGTNGWTNALDAANASPKVAGGSVLAGRFVIPFAKGDNVTFELQLCADNNGAAGNVLKTWKVKLDNASVDGTDTKDNYNIYRNHLYQIGKRGTDSPETPGGDEDKWQPLDKEQEIVIRINDRWEFIHDMEIE